MKWTVRERCLESQCRKEGRVGRGHWLGARQEQQPFFQCRVQSRPEGANFRSERFLRKIKPLKYIFEASVHICFLFVMFCQRHFCENRAITPALEAKGSPIPPGLAPSRPQSVPPVKEELIQLPHSLRDAPANSSPVPLCFKE